MNDFGPTNPEETPVHLRESEPTSEPSVVAQAPASLLSAPLVRSPA
jgi:hypothetical protein